MNATPHFYLTAAGEYRPLAEPRACWVRRRTHDSANNDLLVVDLHPPFAPWDEPDRQLSTVVLSARHRGESIAQIASWPFYVYVSRPVTDLPLEVNRLDQNQLQIIAWARLHPTLEGATYDAQRYAVAERSTRSPETINVRQLRFIGEQDGVLGNALKEQLGSLFADDERIWKAFLARVDHGARTPEGVTLCLRTVMGPDTGLVRSIAKVFTSLFRNSEALDIVFIDNDQEQARALVCIPFFVRTVSRRV